MKKVFLDITNLNRIYSLTNSVLVGIFAIVILSCSKDDDGPPPIAVTEISQEIKDLIYFQGDEKAPIVLVNIPGGPDTSFNKDIVDLIVATSKTTDILNVTVHQAQTLDSTIVKGDDITLDQAVGFNTESIDMLDKVISYFKAQGRTVYVFGFSFGAFATQELIVKKGIDNADKYLIMTGRLDINNVVWQASAEGKRVGFENGVTPVIATDPDPNVKERNLNRVSAGLGMNRYTQLLNPIEDLSDLTYIYGKTDEAVGSLTAEEIQFLQSKNANIISGDGGHGETFFEFIEQGFDEAFGIEIDLRLLQ